ncbi:hypothetical protein [Thiothrix unzii]|jgi:hypothetical protein|uniref:hypothetical protein n=1 Tax=Thiothrix unzii TaxID=111769 RepID=UPI002A36265E|nr:hypothetical protein [Thiothrix unzii]MDX9989546.1 hypothetical protein [Thiothrix unzii]
MKMNTHTEQTAKQKLCPKMMMQDECKGSHCMAWQWTAAKNLSCSTGLLRRYTESAFDGYRDDYAHEMPDLNPANFYQPTGEGWRFHNFEAGDEGWEAMWERDTDPERKGYCAALQHPMAIVDKLEDLTKQGECQ